MATATQAQTFYFQPGGALTFAPAASPESFEEYVSDPSKPVPYTDGIFARRNNEYSCGGLF